MQPTHTLIQISDPHVGPAPGGTRRDPVDTVAILRDALGAVESAALRPTAVLFTGDLVEDGTPEQYDRFQDTVAAAAARLATPMLFVAGNHDRGERLRSHLLDQVAVGPVDYVAVHDGLRIAVLDSTVPGAGYGWLDADQLDRLREHLRTPAPHGTVIALHHPPLPSPTPLASAIALQNTEDLAAAIRGTDVRVILAGHTHVISAGCLGGVPVWTGGAIATTLDALAPGSALRGVSNPTVSRVDLFTEGVVVTSVPIGLPTLTSVPAAVMEPRIAEMRRRLPAAGPGYGLSVSTTGQVGTPAATAPATVDGRC